MELIAGSPLFSASRRRRRSKARLRLRSRRRRFRLRQHGHGTSRHIGIFTFATPVTRRTSPLSQRSSGRAEHSNRRRGETAMTTLTGEFLKNDPTLTQLLAGFVAKGLVSSDFIDVLLNKR